MKFRYQQEFRTYPDLEPEVLQVLQDFGFTEDVSWHNDVCPSFLNRQRKLVLFVDWPAEEDRELETPRFHLCRVDEDMEMLYETRLVRAEVVQELRDGLKRYLEG